METSITIKLTDQEAEDILATALAGAIDYWAGVISAGRVDGVLCAHIMDIEEPAMFDPVMIHAGHIHQGVDALCASPYQRHIIDLMNGNWDATTADVIVQMWLFGKIVVS